MKKLRVQTSGSRLLDSVVAASRPAALFGGLIWSNIRPSLALRGGRIGTLDPTQDFRPAVLAIVLVALLLGGCAHHTAAIDEASTLPDTSAVVIEPAVPDTAGSLWTTQQGSLFYDNKARTVGDIVTVAIFEKASASKEAKTSTSRSSSIEASIPNLLGLEAQLAKLNSDIDLNKLLGAEFDNDFDGEGKTSRKEDLVATLTTQVVGVLPNGNLRIAGGKTVTVNNEQQIVKLTGVVRPADISARNVVDSKNVLDARIAYTGKGAISDNQSPGWLMRFINNVWPF